MHKVRACLLGVRESFGDVVFDRVLPKSLDGLMAETQLGGRAVRLIFAVKQNTSSPRAVCLNGRELPGARECNPYRTGRWRVAMTAIAPLLRESGNLLETEL